MKHNANKPAAGTAGIATRLAIGHPWLACLYGAFGKEGLLGSQANPPNLETLSS